MTNERFKTFIKSIHNAYGKRSPDNEILNFVWSKISFIPDSAVGWIEDRFMTTNDKFPGKLHLAILACWYDWKNAHPDNAVRQEHKCRNKSCVDGVLFLERFEEFYGCKQIYTANCGDCHYVQGAKSYMTLAEAAKQGYSTLDEEAKPEKSPTGFYRGVVDNWQEVSVKVMKEDAIRTAHDPMA